MSALPGRDPLYVRFFEGWTGAAVLAASYVVAQVLWYVLGGYAGLLAFLVWNVVLGPLLMLLVTSLTVRAALTATSLSRRLVVLSSLAVPAVIILLTLRAVARFFGRM